MFDQRAPEQRHFQILEADAIEHWFENVQHHEVALNQAIHAQLPIRLGLQRQLHEPPAFVNHLPSYIQIPSIASVAQVTPPRPAQQRAKLNAASNAARRISALALSPRERCTHAVSIHSAVSWSTTTPLISPKTYPSTPYCPVHGAPTFLASPTALLSALRAPMVVLPRRTLLHHRRQLGEHDEYAALAIDGQQRHVSRLDS